MKWRVQFPSAGGVQSLRKGQKACNTYCFREGRAERTVSQKSSQRSPEIPNVVNKYVKHNVFVKVARRKGSTRRAPRGVQRSNK